MATKEQIKNNALNKFNAKFPKYATDMETFENEMKNNEKFRNNVYGLTGNPEEKRDAYFRQIWGVGEIKVKEDTLSQKSDAVKPQLNINPNDIDAESTSDVPNPKIDLDEMRNVFMKEIEEQRKSLERVKEEPRNASPMQYGGGYFESRNFEHIMPSDKGITEKILEKTEKVLQAPSKDEGSGIGNFLQGVTDNISINDLTLGIADLADNGKILRIVKKLEKDEKLTESEESVLDALYLYNNAQMLRSDNTSTAYNAGAASKESLVFMANMILTSGVGSAVTKGVSKGVSKLMTKLADKGIRRYLRSKGIEASAKNVAKYADDLMSGAVKGEGGMRALQIAGTKVAPIATDLTIGTATQTALSPKAYAMTAEEMTGRVVEDENGNYAVEGGKTAGKAIGSTMIEFLSEKVGNHIVMPKSFSQALNKIPISATARDIFTASTKLTKSAGLNSIPIEFAEEIFANELKRFTNVSTKEEANQFWDPENLKVTMLSIAVIGGISPVINAPSFISYGREKNKLNETLQGIGLNQDEIKIVRNALENGSTIDAINARNYVLNRYAKSLPQAVYSVPDITQDENGNIIQADSEREVVNEVISNQNYAKLMELDKQLASFKMVSARVNYSVQAEEDRTKDGITESIMPLVNKNTNSIITANVNVNGNEIDNVYIYGNVGVNADGSVNIDNSGLLYYATSENPLEKKPIAPSNVQVTNNQDAETLIQEEVKANTDKLKEELNNAYGIDKARNTFTPDTEVVHLENGKPMVNEQGEPLTSKVVSVDDNNIILLTADGEISVPLNMANELIQPLEQKEIQPIEQDAEVNTPSNENAQAEQVVNDEAVEDVNPIFEDIRETEEDMGIPYSEIIETQESEYKKLVDKFKKKPSAENKKSVKDALQFLNEIKSNYAQYLEYKKAKEEEQAQVKETPQGEVISNESEPNTDGVTIPNVDEVKETADGNSAEGVDIKDIPEMTDDTPQDARARGVRKSNGEIFQRQEGVEGIQGKEVKVKFSNDNIKKCKVMVIDINQLQASHKGGVRNPLHFIDEAQPKERTGDDSLHEAEKIAKNIRPEEITTSITAYTGAPTINSRGEVIQGNNRSEALRVMYNTESEQAQKYKDYLVQHAEEFGLKAEDIQAMESPVLVNMLDVTDEEAIELGQYVAQDTESGGIERIKPINTLNKMGENVGTFTNLLLKNSEEGVSLSELIDKNGNETLAWLNQKGYISPAQYRSAFDSRGNITGEAKNDIKEILYHNIFQNANPLLREKFNSLPVKAQRAILSTAYRDALSPKEQSILKDLQESINAYYNLMQQDDFANAKNNEQRHIALFTWLHSTQIDLATGETFTPSERYNNFAIELAQDYFTDTQTTIQQKLNKVFDIIQGTQEETLFDKPDNTPKTKEEAIKQIFNIDYNANTRSDLLEGDNSTGERGQQGSDGEIANKEQTQSGNGATDNRGGTSTNAEQVTEVTPEEKSKKVFEAVRKVVEKAGLVIHEATPEMVAKAKEKSGLEFMGTRVDKRMSDIEQHFSNKALTEEQRNIVDVFSGKKDNVSIKFKTADGTTRTIMFRQGNENKSGVKHILFRHYNTQSSPINADDVLLIPYIIENGIRTETKKGSKKSIDYKFTDTNGIEYTLVTEQADKIERVVTYYANRKGGNSHSSNTQLRAQIGNTTSSASKGTTNNSNNQKVFEKKSDGTILGWVENGEIYLTPEGLNSETLIHEYTHLWVQCVKKLHPKKWNEIKDTLKSCKELWDAVVNDPMYSDIKDDEDAVASEVLSRFSGKDGEQRMLDALDNADKKTTKSIIDKAKQAIKDFWNEVVKLFGLDTKSFSKNDFGSIENISMSVFGDVINSKNPIEIGNLRETANDVLQRIEFSMSPENRLPSNNLNQMEGESNTDYIRRATTNRITAFFEFNKKKSRLSNYIFDVIDDGHPMYEIVDELKKKGIKVPAELDIYKNWGIYRGRMQNEQKVFEALHLEKMLSACNKLVNTQPMSNVSGSNSNNLNSEYEAFCLYLRAKDIVEVQEGKNEEGKPFSDTFKARGVDAFSSHTGMSAKEYVEMYEKAVGNTELIDNVWNAINDVRKYNADLLLDAKLISKDFHKILLARKFYVPQRGWEERDALKGFMNEEYFDLKKVGQSGKGLTPTSAIASGEVEREHLSGNPLAYLLNMVYDTQMRSYQNKYLLEVFVPFLEKYKDDLGGSIVEVGNYSAKAYAKAIEEGSAFTRNEKKQKYIWVINQDKSEEVSTGPYKAIFTNDIRMANVLNGGHDYNSAIPNWLAVTNRFLAQTLTTYNPYFALANFLRDAQAGFFNSFIDYGPKFAGRFAINLKNNFKRIWNEEEQERFDRFLKGGGAVGYAQYKTYDDLRKDMEGLVAHGSTRGRVGKSVDFLFTEKGFISYVRKVTEFFELVSRYSAYTTALDCGMSETDALFASRDVVVDLGQRGYKTTSMGRLFVFSTAILKSALKAYKQIKDPETLWKYAVVAIGGIIVGMVQSLYGGDDDYINVSDYKRTNTLIIPFGDTRVTIPLGHGFRAYNAIGVRIGDYLQGRTSFAQCSSDAINALSGEFFPTYMNIPLALRNINDGEILKLTGQFMPSALAPLMEIATNENKFGSKISKDKYDIAKPDVLDGINPSSVSQAISKHLYEDWAGGITSYEKAIDSEGNKINYFDVSPSTIDHLANSYLRHFKFVGDIANWALAEDSDEYTTSFVKQFINETNHYAISSSLAKKLQDEMQFYIKPQDVAKKGYITESLSGAEQKRIDKITKTLESVIQGDEFIEAIVAENGVLRLFESYSEVYEANELALQIARIDLARAETDKQEEDARSRIDEAKKAKEEFDKELHQLNLNLQKALWVIKGIRTSE